jgi:hypothetical protein
MGVLMTKLQAPRTSCSHASICVLGNNLPALPRLKRNAHMGPRPLRTRTPRPVLATTSITRRDTCSRNLFAQRRCTVNTPKHLTPMQLLWADI